MNQLRLIEPEEEPSREQRLREELRRRWQRRRGAVYSGEIEEDRKRRIWQFVLQLEVAGKRVLEVGVGETGQRLRGEGTDVTSIDAVEEALQQTTAKTQCEMLPHTSLPSEAFDLVLCTDVLAEVPKPQYRLAINELQRVLKRNGTLVCSTSLSLNTTGALERFTSLVETEFAVEELEIAYHGLSRKLKLQRSFRWLERLSRQPSWVILLARKKTICEARDKRAGDTT